MKSYAPAFIASTASETVPTPVRTTMGDSTPSFSRLVEEDEAALAGHAEVGHDDAGRLRPRAWIASRTELASMAR